MSNWRARRYSFTINRRTVTLTVRRFRLAKKVAQTATRKQYLYNVRLGRLRQLALEYKRPKSNKRALRSAFGFQAAVATLLIVSGLSGITYSAVALARPNEIPASNTFVSKTQPPKPTQPAAVKQQALAKSTPTRISIASQQIDVNLIPVGLAEDGSIELPPVLDWIAGWYKYSPTPGEIGPAVIVGHVDSYEGESVFWRLGKVQAGDIIDVDREDGSTARFKVTQLAEYDQNNFPTETVYGDTMAAEIRVITCSGTFDPIAQHYTQNTVVYAELIT